MKKVLLLSVIAFLFLCQACNNEKQVMWEPAHNPLMTKWAFDVDPAMPWPEYPRPQMVRDQWMNLNGLWDYQLQREGTEVYEYDQKILVPFPVESALSGIADSVGPNDVIWYRREFAMQESWKGKEIILNFEAVDWQTTVMINGKEVGTHKGGYDPFYYNITSLLNEDGDNELVVKVTDPTSEGYQPRGKQVLNPHGIWYTPTSGIWQTVWLEAVPQTYIEEIFITPQPDDKRVIFEFNCAKLQQGDKIEVKIKDGDELISGVSGDGSNIEVGIDDIRWWSPASPFLYDVEVLISRDGEVIDRISSYFGMRKIHKGMDDDGFVRLYLNNELAFHNGPLDQGFWPDGLYTPPTDEAMKYDIQVTKDLGFNMLRKHVKVENRRFYYWCDKMGIMVWQDMPSTSGYVGRDKPDLDRPQNEVDQFKYELKQMILTKYNHPSIVMWVPFNEGWGQFDTEGIVDFIYELDDTRLVNNTSGWMDRGVGDVIDIHNYPEPRFPEPEAERASVLGEFGGLGLYVDGHTWEEKNWGYKKMDDSASLIMKYAQFYDTVWHMMENNGLAAAVYTQTTDVETETNGLMTYDREIIKMDSQVLHRINTNNYVASGGNVEEESTRTERIPPVYYYPFDERYSGGGFYALLDEKYGSLNYSDGKWQGYRDSPMEVLIDLGTVRKISSVSGNFLQNHEGWIFLPKLFTVSTSIDKKEFSLQGEIENEVPSDYLEPAIQMISLDKLDVEARYVRIKALGVGPAPKWHTVARERPTWFFIDEIIVK